MSKLPQVGEIGLIPVAIIRPFAGQPRRHFDEASLRDLAESIAAEGQRTPAWVMPIDDSTHSYELIAGERRWRACQIAGIPDLRCEVRAPESAAAQYIDSVMENFGRKDCTALEAARAIAEVMRLRFGPNPKHGDKAVIEVAKVFARSTAWVSQHLMLLRLHPDVQEMMERGLAMQVAVALSNLRPEVQVELANDIMGRKLRLRPALWHIRSRVSNGERVVMTGRRRKPSDDFSIVLRFLTSLGEQAEALLAIPPAQIAAMFAKRPPEALGTIGKVLRRRIEELQQLESSLRKAAK